MGIEQIAAISATARADSSERRTSSPKVAEKRTTASADQKASSGPGIIAELEASPAENSVRGQLMAIAKLESKAEYATKQHAQQRAMAEKATDPEMPQAERNAMSDKLKEMQQDLRNRLSEKQSQEAERSDTPLPKVKVEDTSSIGIAAVIGGSMALLRVEDLQIRTYESGEADISSPEGAKKAIATIDKAQEGVDAAASRIADVKAALAESEPSPSRTKGYTQEVSSSVQANQQAKAAMESVTSDAAISAALEAMR